MVGTTSQFITVLLDVAADVGSSKSAAPPACGQLAPERLALLLRTSLRTCLESIGEAALSPIAGPDWGPYGPGWLLESDATPLDDCLDLSRFSRMIEAEPRTEYAMIAETGFDLWSDANQRHVIRGCLERFFLDLQYQDFDDELDDLLE